MVILLKNIKRMLLRQTEPVNLTKGAIGTALYLNISDLPISWLTGMTEGAHFIKCFHKIMLNKALLQKSPSNSKSSNLSKIKTSID